MVELAICATLLIVIAFGIVEFGNAWNRKLEVETSARAGARVGSSLGNDRTADQGLLQATVSVLNDFGLSNVNYVVVFKSTTADGTRQGTCANSPPVASAGLCNVYTGTQLQNLPRARLHDCVHRQHRPGGRQELVSDRPSDTCSRSAADYLGVYVQANYVTATGLFKSPFYLSSRAVMRLEPK